MKIRDRVKSLRRVKASELLPNPKNWRTHPEAQQDALRGVLAEIGYADTVLVRETPAGLMIIDGHLRADLGADGKIPCLVLDVTATEADKLLATLDPLAAMAEADQKALGELLATIETESGALQTMLEDLANQEGVDVKAGPEEPQQSGPPIGRGACLEDLAPTEEEMAELQGRRILVEFSGGKDSSAAVIWVRQFLPQAALELIFADMGADFIGFELFLQRFAAWAGAGLVTLRSRRNIIAHFLAKGEWPHFRHPYCHDLLHGALDAYVESQPAAEIVMVRGGRLQEKAAASKAAKTRWLKIERLPDVRYFQPLYFADKGSSEKILQKAEAPVWEGYARGLCRTACRICPGQRPAAYAGIRREFPEVWRELEELEARLGPGCWQGRRKDQVPTFTELADKADAKQKSP